MHVVLFAGVDIVRCDRQAELFAPGSQPAAEALISKLSEVIFTTLGQVPLDSNHQIQCDGRAYIGRWAPISRLLSALWKRVATRVMKSARR